MVEPPNRDEARRRFAAGNAIARALLTTAGFESQELEHTPTRQIVLAKRGEEFIILLRKLNTLAPQSEACFLFALQMKDFTLDELRTALTP